MAGILMDKYRYAPPLASQFATLNSTNSQSATRADQTGRGLVIDFGNSPGAGDNVRGVMKAKTTLTTTYSIIARMICCNMVFSFNIMGLCLYDGTKFVTFGNATGAAGNPDPGMKIDQWTNATTFSSEPLIAKAVRWMEWMRIDVISGAPTDFFVSDNGTDWIKVLSSSQAGFLTYTHVGFVTHVNRNGGPFPVSGTNQQTSQVLYYKDPDIDPGF